MAEGGDPHSKLHRLLEIAPSTGRHWYRPDMTAEHHASTVQDWVQRAPSSFRAQTAARGRAGSRSTFDAQLARARQEWLFVEPCMRDPLMITPLGPSVHPHFKQPPPQGWSQGCSKTLLTGARSIRTANGGSRRRARAERDRRRELEYALGLDVLGGEAARLVGSVCGHARVLGGLEIEVKLCH